MSRRQSLTYAFDNTNGARTRQDVGLDGLSNDDEKTFSTYRDFVAKLETILSPAVVERLREDPFSPFNDPASDDYHFIGVSITMRLKRLFCNVTNITTEWKETRFRPRMWTTVITSRRGVCPMWKTSIRTIR